LKVGSRVRCTDDGVEGRITWANAVSVKIRWDDGEQVTWRRDSLADRPLEVLDPPTDEPACLPEEPAQAPTPQPATARATAELLPASAPEPPAAEPAPQLEELVKAPTSEPTTASAADEPPVEQSPADPSGAEAPREQIPSEGEVPAVQRTEEMPPEQPGAETPQDGAAMQAGVEEAEVAQPDKSKRKRQRKESKAKGKEKKRSALD